MVVHFFDVSMTHLSPSIMKSFLINFGIEGQKMILCAHKKMLFGAIEDEKQKFIDICVSMNFYDYEFLYQDEDIVKKLILEAKIGNLCVLHGYFYFSNRISKIVKIFFNYRVLKNVIKIHWSVDKIEHLTIKSRIKHFFDTYIHSLIRYNVVLIDGEKNFLNNIYDKKLNNIEVAPYLGTKMGLESFYRLRELNNFLQKEKRVIVAHSGHIHNGHIKVLDILKEKYDNVVKEISMPLCYGPSDYIEQVVQYGKHLFGDRFNYFTQLMDRVDYVEYIRMHDVFITAAPIQTGLFALGTALGNGLKVFCTGLLYDKYKKDGYIVYDLCQLVEEDVLSEPMSNEDILINYKKTIDISLFNDRVNKWKSILR